MRIFPFRVRLSVTLGPVELALIIEITRLELLTFAWCLK